MKFNDICRHACRIDVTYIQFAIIRKAIAKKKLQRVLAQHEFHNKKKLVLCESLSQNITKILVTWNCRVLSGTFGNNIAKNRVMWILRAAQNRVMRGGLRPVLHMWIVLNIWVIFNLPILKFDPTKITLKFDPNIADCHYF